MKSKEEIIKSQYLCIQDICTLFGMNKNAAKKVFDRCLQRDYEELQDRLIYTKKVRLQTVLKDQGINFNILTKQIKSASSLTGQSA